MADFVARYRPTVVRYLERQGLGHESEDVAQEVFCRLLVKDAMKRVGEGKGSFRSFLFVVTRNALRDHLQRARALKRGGGKEHAPLEEGLVAEINEEAFDQEWIMQMIENAMGRLAEHHPNYYSALRGVLWEERPQAEVAATLERTPRAIRNEVHRGKNKLVSYLKEEIARCTPNTSQYRTEVELLQRYLGDK